MYFNFYYLFLFLRKYIKQKDMRLLLTFILFILGGFYTFGKENYCEECCEYLGIFCNKGKGEENEKGNKEEGKGEVQEEFYLKKTKADNSKEIKKLVSTKWYDNKGKNASFFLYEKIDNMENLDLNNNDVIKVTKDKNGFRINKNFITENDNNTQKWALFEIIYKEEEKEKETKYLYCSDIESISIEKFHFGIFFCCKQHVSISVIACDTSGVTDMGSMFSRCSSLTELDLSNFNTETVTNMIGMFFECSSLTKLNLSKFDTENVKKMPCMFYNCSSLQIVTFNKNLNKGIEQTLNNLGFTEKVKEEGKVITLKKKQ